MTEPKPEPKPIVGAAIVDSLQDPRQLLAARRTAPPAFAGMWEFPGGKVEPGEGPQAALHRELCEELGVKVRLGPEVEGPTTAGWPLSGSASMRVWLAELAQGEPAPLQDHDALRWVPLDTGTDLLALPWIPADFAIVRAVLDLCQTGASMPD